MSKKKIRLAFEGFNSWTPFPAPRPEIFFPDILADEFDVTVTNEDPDYLIDTGRDPHAPYHCTKIYFPNEVRRPDFQNYQWCITHDFCDDPRHYRMPTYVMFADVNLLKQPKPPSEPLWDRKFCATMWSAGPIRSPREDFFHALNARYKRVDSAGRRLNNVGIDIPGVCGKPKIDFIKNYKFMIAFENESSPGYTSEKIFEAMLANCVPIYWGNPLIGLDFNPKSFINCNDYSNLDAMVDRVVEVDQNKEEYLKILSEPWYNNNQVNQWVRRENIQEFFHRVMGG